MMKVNEGLTIYAFVELSTKTCNAWNGQLTSVAKHLSVKGHKQRAEYMLWPVIFTIRIQWFVLHLLNKHVGHQELVASNMYSVLEVAQILFAVPLFM